MTKTELIEKYTAEQLAEMVFELQVGKERKVFEVSDNKNYQKELDEFLKENPIQSTIDKICKDILEQKNNAMAMEFVRIICGLLRENGVYVHCTETKFSEKITNNSIEEKYGIKFDSMDFSQHDKEFTDKIEELKKQLDRSQTAISQIDYILEKLFDVRHDTVDKPDEFERILKQKAENYNTIADYLCDEPISVAQTLISAKRSYELSAEEKQRSGLEKGYYHIFDVSELRQIAEHLLVYCNHNGRSRNEKNKRVYIVLAILSKTFELPKGKRPSSI